MKKLYLSNSDRKIGGVCGGIGEYFDKDSMLIRIIFILLILFSFGFGILVYSGNVANCAEEAERLAMTFYNTMLLSTLGYATK